MITVDDLLDYKNKDEVGTRFPPSDYRCPICKKYALQDNWPPNYFSGGGLSMSGRQKIVCLGCKIQATVYWEHEDALYDIRHGRYGWKTVNIEYIKIKELVELNGKYLTDHDVWREENKEELERNPMLDAYG